MTANNNNSLSRKTYSFQYTFRLYWVSAIVIVYFTFPFFPVPSLGRSLSSREMLLIMIFALMVCIALISAFRITTSIAINKGTLIVPFMTSYGYPIPLFFKRKFPVSSIKKIIWFRDENDALWRTLPTQRIHIIGTNLMHFTDIALAFYGECNLDDLVDTLVSLNGDIEVKEYDAPEGKRFSDIEIVPGGRGGANVMYRPRRE